jgi:hypothetical protein
MIQGAPSVHAVFFSLLHRITASTCLCMVSVLDSLTADNLTGMQGLYLGLLVFLIAEAVHSGAIRLQLFKRVCLLYCNQRVRGLFDYNSTVTAAITDLCLAVSVAVLMMMCSSSKDAESLLTSLMYLYGDVLDFALVEYGVMEVTVFALGVSVVLERSKPPVDKIWEFGFNLSKIVCSNLVCEGVDLLMQSDAMELELLECMATVAILRLFLPSMSSYITYIASKRMVYLLPHCSPLFACVVVFIVKNSFIPESGRAWLGELSFNYIVIDVSTSVRTMTFQWTVFLVIILHYVDHIVTGHMKKLGVK